jgi:hypothetical protein
MNSGPSDFVVTTEYQRFAEFCDACRRYGYIGLCYGAPGVGKTLSARHYANWENIAAALSAREASVAALTALLASDTVFYTPGIVNTPAQVAHDIEHLRSALRAIRVEARERKHRVHLEKVLTQEKAAEAERQRQIFVELDWFADPVRLKNSAASIQLKPLRFGVYWAKGWCHHLQPEERPWSSNS